jgi:hypothetical protein
VKLGPRPTLDAALTEILRVGQKVGGDTARQWARELRLIAERLAEGSKWGPKGVVWPGEAARLKLAADIAELGHERRRAALAGKSLADHLPGLEAKATTDLERLDVAVVRLQLEAAVADELEQIRLARRGRAS